MTENRPALRRCLPIVLDRGPHSERQLWVGRSALDFCSRGRDEPAQNLLQCLELAERVRRRAAELRLSRRAGYWLAST